MRVSTWVVWPLLRLPWRTKEGNSSLSVMTSSVPSTRRKPRCNGPTVSTTVASVAIAVCQSSAVAIFRPDSAKSSCSVSRRPSDSAMIRRFSAVPATRAGASSMLRSAPMGSSWRRLTATLGTATAWTARVRPPSAPDSLHSVPAALLGASSPGAAASVRASFDAPSAVSLTGACVSAPSAGAAAMPRASAETVGNEKRAKAWLRTKNCSGERNSSSGVSAGRSASWPMKSKR